MLLAYVVLPAVMMTTEPGQLHWNALGSVDVYNYSTLLGGPLFEEPGWRRFALPRLEARWGPLRATFLLSLIWAGWHLPRLFDPDLRHRRGPFRRAHTDRAARGIQYCTAIPHQAVCRHSAECAAHAR